MIRSTYAGRIDILLIARRTPLRVVRLLAVSAVALLLIGDVLTLMSGSRTAGALASAAGLFWADGEANVWAWFSSVLLACVALCFFDLMTAAASIRERRAYAFLGAIALLMSLDEVAALHERLGKVVPRADTITWPWLIVGAPLAAIAGVALVLVARDIDRDLRRRLIIAGGVYLLGALVVEAVGGALTLDLHLRPSDLLYVAEVTVEEGLETTGVLMALAAGIAALQRSSRPSGHRADA